MANSNEISNTSRRRFFALTGTAIGAAAVIGALPRHALAADLPHLTLDDATAKALGYTEDATKVDPKKYPTFKPGEDCSNCNFYKGAAGSTYGPCQLYPGKAVHSKGWCSGYAKKA